MDDFMKEVVKMAANMGQLAKACELLAKQNWELQQRVTALEAMQAAPTGAQIN